MGWIHNVKTVAEAVAMGEVLGERLKLRDDQIAILTAERDALLLKLSAAELREEKLKVDKLELEAKTANLELLLKKFQEKQRHEVETVRIFPRGFLG